MGAGEGLDVLGDRVGMPVWGAAEGDFVGLATHEISNEGVSLARLIVFEVSPVWKLQSTSRLLLNKLNDTVPNIGGNDCSPEFSVKISVPATSFSFNAVKVNVVPVFCNPETCVESVTSQVCTLGNCCRDQDCSERTFPQCMADNVPNNQPVHLSPQRLHIVLR